MEIYILSRGRATKQTTFISLPEGLKNTTKIVVPKSEVEDYRGLPVIGIDANGIGPTRQWCLENSPSGMVLMLDDDLTFATRREDDRTKFRPSTDNEIHDLFCDIAERLQEYVHVGVSAREGANRRTENYLSVGRMLRMLAYQSKTVNDLNICYNNLPVMEDFDVTLSLLRKGQPNCIINHMVHNQNGSGLEGGCSVYRDKEMQTIAANMLAKKHHSYVTVVQKETKTAWGGGVRTDVRIQWKKAYEDSKNA